MTGGSGGSSRRAGPRALASPRTHGGLSGYQVLTPPLQVAAGVLAAVGVAGAALGGMAWTTPPAALVSTPGSATERMAFSYSATVPESPAYDDTHVTAPEPVFRRLTDTVEVSFTYTGSGSGDRTLAVAAELSAGSGWRSTVPLARPVSVSPGEHEGRVVLDLAGLDTRAVAAARVPAHAVAAHPGADRPGGPDRRGLVHRRGPGPPAGVRLDPGAGARGVRGAGRVDPAPARRRRGRAGGPGARPPSRGPARGPAPPRAVRRPARGGRTGHAAPGPPRRRRPGLRRSRGSPSGTGCSSCTGRAAAPTSTWCRTRTRTTATGHRAGTSRDRRRCCPTRHRPTCHRPTRPSCPPRASLRRPGAGRCCPGADDRALTTGPRVPQTQIRE
jgi:hypothetical protein